MSGVNVGNATVYVGSVRISLGMWECVSECVSTGGRERGRRIDTECTTCVFMVCIYCVCMYIFFFFLHLRVSRVGDVRVHVFVCRWV